MQILSECGDYELLKANLSPDKLAEIEEALISFNDEFLSEVNEPLYSIVTDWFAGNISAEKLIKDILKLDNASGDILNKFDVVEIKNNSRLSAEDAKFCEEQQALYEKTSLHYREIFSKLNRLKELDAEFSDSVAGSNAFNSGGYRIYKAEIFKFDENDYLELMKNTHNVFINQINGYFKDKYKITVDCKDAEVYLDVKEPKEPHTPYRFSYGSEEYEEEFKKSMDGYQLAKVAYVNAITNSVLHYDAIVDDIFILLGAFTFEEQAEKEIKEGSLKAVRGYDGKRKYSVKSKRISFDILSSHKCHIFKTHEVSLDSRDYKALLRALAYFDSDRKNLEIYDSWLNRFVYYKKHERESIYDTHTAHGNKTVNFRYFKNGKFEVEFINHTEALKFAGEYLGYREEAA